MIFQESSCAVEHTHQVTPVKAYVHNVLLHQQFQIRDGSHMRFVIQDADENGVLRVRYRFLASM